MVRFGFLFATGTGGGFVRTQRTTPPYGPESIYNIVFSLLDVVLCVIVSFVTSELFAH